MLYRPSAQGDPWREADECGRSQHLETTIELDGESDFSPDPRVDSYIESLPAWQQTVCREVRALVHAADPEVTETIKRTKLPYFVLEGNICALLATKDHVNVFL
jgi:hypothetical protein